jgi:hypothetical protein
MCASNKTLCHARATRGLRYKLYGSRRRASLSLVPDGLQQSSRGAHRPITGVQALGLDVSLYISLPCATPSWMACLCPTAGQDHLHLILL